MNKTQIFLHKHSSTILTVIGVGGVIGTAVMSVKATPKALRLLEEAEIEKGSKLTKKEVVKVAWKCYIPATIVGVSTIACIVGANYLSDKKQTSLMSAYALLDQAYKDYRRKVQDTYGDDKNVKYEIMKEKYNDTIEVHEGEILFFDFQSMRFFESTIDKVMQAECAFKEAIEYRGYGLLNEYYEMLNIPPVEYGYEIGWNDVEDNDPYDCHKLEFNYEKVTIEGDLECFIIDVNEPPSEIVM